MSDEQIEAGDHVITSGGDRIYPKGFSVGTVISAIPDKDNDPFLAIKIKPTADLSRLEEVMVVTKMAEEAPSVAGGPSPMRAADILAQRLPSVPKQDPNAAKTPGSTSAGSTPTTGASAAASSPTPPKSSQPTGTGNVAGAAKQPATASGSASPSVAKKTGTEAKPVNSGQAAVPASAGGSPTPTPVKPKAAPKKPSVPATAPDATSPGTAEPKSSEPKASDQSGTVVPAATPTPTPERLQI